MPHRVVIGKYLYAVVAGSSLLLGFTASVKESVQRPPSRPMYAASDDAATPAVPAPDAAMLSWLGFASTALVVLGKAYFDWRDKNRAANIADAKAWGTLLAEARAELGDATSDLRTQTRLAAEAKSAAAEAKAAADAKTARINELQAQNNAQAVQIADLQSKINKLATSQNSVISAVNKQQDRVKEAVKRVGVIEQAVGSSSGIEFPALPDDGTAPDLPTIPPGPPAQPPPKP